MVLRKYVLVTSIVLVSLLSCKDDDQNFKDFDAGGTKTEALAGEWFVREYDDSTPRSATSEYFKIFISNTADNSVNEVLISRLENGEIVQQFKAKADVTSLTFEAIDVENLEDDSEIISVSEGRIIKDGTVATSSKTVIDSVAFRFSSNVISEPILVAGHRRSGFVEDEVVE